MEGIQGIPSLLALCKSLLLTEGVTGGVILLAVALFFYMPSNMAYIKNLRSQKLIAFLNTLALLALPLDFFIPLLLFLLSAFLAAIGRARSPKPQPVGPANAPPRRPLPAEPPRPGMPERTGKRY